jgi:Na+/H+-dicarboxylate symporter
MIRIVHWVLWLAPVGVFALAAPVTAKLGWEILRSLGVFVGAVILALLLFVGAVYLPIVASRGTRIAAFLRACLAPQAIALSTASSAAALPAMLDSSDRLLAVSRNASSFVVPLGVALNRAGSALFQGAAVVFLAKLYQVPLNLTGALSAWLATFLVSLTVAAVPSASVVTLAPALNSVGIPLEGLAVLLGVDRIPDMFRTATNVTGTMAATVMGKGEWGMGNGER